MKGPALAWLGDVTYVGTTGKRGMESGVSHESRVGNPEPCLQRCYCSCPENSHAQETTDATTNYKRSRCLASQVYRTLGNYDLL